MKKTVLLCTLLIAVLFSFSAVLADNTSDLIDMIRTEVASTVVAEIRQTLESEDIEIIVKNSGTPSPNINTGFVWGTWKPTPTYYSYQATFVKQDKNYMHYAHGVQFTVTWTVRNTGPLPWDTQFYFRYVQGQGSLNGDLYMLPYAVERGDTITFSRSFECADEPGIYNSYWELVDNDGVVILDNIWVGWQVDDWRDFQ
ncbi:MAG: hypothetical protein IKP86_14485 [Anaerolineaceae bacterium]|nr:hypothetical protein [Anaerolineaceae bacterium]